MSGMTIDRFQVVGADDAEASVQLRLTVTDPEVVAELRRAGDEQTEFALSALRLGVLALKQARGQLDGDTLRREGENLLSQVQHALSSHQKELNVSLATSLKEYFDPQSGRFNERVDRLLKKDGELESLLASKLTSPDSELHRTLEALVGKDSALWQLLSPDQGDGFLKYLKGVLAEELEEQRKQVLKEFSLDDKQSALSRLVGELDGKNGKLKEDLQGQFDAVVKEFSLDEEDSALSRLLKQIETAHSAISNEFTLDKEDSALSRMKKAVESTNEVITLNLTLDDEKSSLFRLKREMFELLQLHQEQSRKFQCEISEQLTRMQTRREEAARTTRHGDEFEAQCLDFLAEESRKCGDVLTATGRETGLMRGRKFGDAVIELNRESLAGGAKVVVEAKEEKDYDVKKALEEIENARKNRDAEVGVFVFSKRVAPGQLDAFARHGNDLLVIWDAEDASTDIWLRAALSVAKALCTRKALEQEKAAFDTEPISKAILEIEKQMQLFEEVDQAVSGIRKGSDKIENRLRIARDCLNRQILTLQQQLETIRERMQE